MHNFENKTIREIALDAPLTVRVFENYKIDFCCGGRVPFAEACEKAGVAPSAVLADLEAAVAAAPQTIGDRVDRKDPSELIEYIIGTHHTFTRSEIERLRPLAEKVWSRHGENHPELAEIARIFNTLADELLLHMQKEEQMLFPYIENLEIAAKENRAPQASPFGTVNNPVRVMMFEHDQAGEMLRRLRSLSSDYTAPEGACPSYKGLFAGLENLEHDLHRHIHLENNVLFPKAVEFEKRAFGEAVAAA